MIDHLGVSASDLALSRRFYDATLAALGLKPLMEVMPQESGGYHGIGYGEAGKPLFWLTNDRDHGGTRKDRGTGVHIAFAAPKRAAVDAFYVAAMAHGGRDNGTPGIRPHYHANYYAAFVLDPDGYNIEAVCHAPG